MEPYSTITHIHLTSLGHADVTIVPVCPRSPQTLSRQKYEVLQMGHNVHYCYFTGKWIV